MWENKSGNFMTLKKMNVDFCLLEFSATKIVTWKCHLDEPTNGRYGMILGRDLLTALGMDLKFSDTSIICGEGPHEGCFALMVELSNNNVTSIADKTVKPRNNLLTNTLTNTWIPRA